MYAGEEMKRFAPRSVRKAAWRCCRSSRSGPCWTPARAACIAFSQLRLAVLNSGSHTDDAREIFDTYRDFGHQSDAAQPGHQAAPGKRRLRPSSTAKMIQGFASICSRCCATSSTPTTRFRVIRRSICQKRTHDDCGVSYPAQCAGTAPERGSEYRRVLGWALDWPRGVRLHQGSRLPVRVARAWMFAPAGPGAMKGQ